MKNLIYFLLFTSLLLVISCSKDNIQPEPANDPSFSTFMDLEHSGIAITPVPTNQPPAAPLLIRPRSSGIIFFSDPDDFYCSDLPTEDFEEGPDEMTSFPHPLDEFSDNEAFSPGDILPGVSMSASADLSDRELVLIPPSAYGNTSKTVVVNRLVDYFIITFTMTGINAVSMDVADFRSYPVNQVRVEVFGSSGSLGTAYVQSSAAGSYLAMRTIEDITSITIRSSSFEGVDNLAFGTANCINIDGCNPGVTDYVFSNGDTMMGLILDCASEAVNHGDFVTCVSHLTNEWKKEGLITGDEKEAIMDCVGSAGIPE